MYGQRPRSPEPYRSRPYSPSRPLPPRSRSPSPRRKYPDAAYPVQSYRPSPPTPASVPPRPAKYDYDPEYEYPASRRYDDGPSRYDDDRYYRRSPPPPPRDRERSPYGYRSPPPLPRSGAMRSRSSSEREDREKIPYEERYPPRGMAADREESRRSDIPQGPRHAARDDSRWERGQIIEEEEEVDRYAEPSGTRGIGGTRKKPSDPSRDVIFLGLDPELTEKDFIGYLKVEHQAQVESVKIVMDKVTGQSKCFGFAAFSSIQDAEEFINHNFPIIMMPALYSHSDPRKVKVDFSASLTGSNAPGDGGSQWGIGHIPRPGHDGMRDIGSPGGGNRVLLLRGLNYHSKPDEICYRLGEEISRMLGRHGQAREAMKSITRLVVITDKAARTSWGYGFIELATTELATALLGFLISPQNQPQGFQISEFAVAASFANPASFIPTPAGPLGSELVVRACRKGGIGSTTVDGPEGTWVAYWNPDAIPQETVPNGASKVDESGNLEVLSDETKQFLGHLAGGEASKESQSNAGQSAQQSQVAASAGPISISMTGMQPISMGNKRQKVEAEGFVSKNIKNTKSLLMDDDETADDIGTDSVLLSRTKGVANIIGPSTRKVAKDISKWNTKKTELSVPLETDWTKRPGGMSEANTAIGVPRATTQTATKSEDKEQTFDYTDSSSFTTTGKMACLLCQRQFKAEEALKKHVAQSDLHKTNLLNPSLCEAGKQRKAAAGTKQSSTTPTPGPGPETSKYRDRAAERREFHHQPDKPVPEESPNQPVKRKFAEGPKPPPPASAPGMEPGKDESNRGNQLLAKMGWTSGVGLGMSGEGRVDPIAVQQFENRAGLGASKGHDATKWQGPGGFQNRARDMTQERFKDL